MNSKKFVSSFVNELFHYIDIERKFVITVFNSLFGLSIQIIRSPISFRQNKMATPKLKKKVK